MKTILVTGGAGFVGSHLSEALVKQGNKVIILDDFSNGNIANIESIKKKISVIKNDITLPYATLEKVLKNYKFDGVYHLACFPRSMSLQNPFRDLEVNARGTLNILELTKSHNAKMVFTSNSGIYGEPEYLPVDEKHPDKPSTPYDANKLVSEYYMKIYHKIYHVKIGICRLATVYGDRQRAKPDWKPLIAEFATKLKADQAPTIYWDGEQTRDFIYVKDVVQGLMEAMDSDETRDEVFLLSNSIETTINEIYLILLKALKKNIEPLRAGKVPGDIRRMLLSSEKARRTFGFKPKFNLEQGIMNYLSWLETQ